MKFYRGNIILHPKKLGFLNTIKYDNVDYIIKPLDVSFKKSKGGNSNVFILEDPNNDLEFVIKFSKFDIININEYTEKRILRFSREIEALDICKNNGKNRIIEILFDGEVKIDGKKFKYYVMEKAESDLTQFLNHNILSIQQKLSLCLEVLEGIKQLHNLDMYHRDIKPDNVLKTSNGWKIGDLGLIDFRDSDFEIDEKGEKIGPIGWLSPEAANKFLCEGTNRLNPFNHDIELNYNSDIFQLGKLFWYIFQGNIPIGQLEKQDFIIEDSELFAILFKMLSYSKNKRYNLLDLEKEFTLKSKRYAAF